MGWSILFFQKIEVLQPACNFHTTVLTADDYDSTVRVNYEIENKTLALKTKPEIKEEMLALNSILKHNGTDTSFTEK